MRLAGLKMTPAHTYTLLYTTHVKKCFFFKLTCVHSAHIVNILLRWTDGSKLTRKTILWVHQYYKIGPDRVPLLNQT